MPDSDDEYIQTISDEEVEAHLVTRSKGRSERLSRPARTATRGTDDGKGGGFEVSRTWETVVEGEDGTISGAIEGLLEAGKRRRLLKDTTPLQRGIIRHLVVIIDFSSAMVEKDFRPTRHLLTIRYAQEFVTEYFEQNPISQLGIIGMRDGLAVRVSDMSGNPNDHITSLQTWRDKEPMGNPSLQNALEMARGALFHAPSHGTREVLLIFGALLSSDPGDIHTTIAALVKAHITCTVIGLAAEVAICRTLVARTNPSTNTHAAYSVALHEQHYRELIMAATTPPATAGPSPTSISDPDSTTSSHNSLLKMGFPSRIVETNPSLCACHSRPTRGGYLCSRCRSKVCSLPTTCPACSLTLILSTHLARSYHHLFPLRNWAEVSWKRAAEHTDQSACFSCMAPFPDIPEQGAATKAPPPVAAGKNDSALTRALERKRKPETHGRKQGDGGVGASGVSESSRYECGTCGRFFCIDCDVFSHEVVHNCPGCQSLEGMLEAMQAGQGVEDDVAMGGVDAGGLASAPVVGRPVDTTTPNLKGKETQAGANGR